MVLVLIITLIIALLSITHNKHCHLKIAVYVPLVIPSLWSAYQRLNFKQKLGATKTRPSYSPGSVAVYCYICLKVASKKLILSANLITLCTMWCSYRNYKFNPCLQHSLISFFSLTVISYLSLSASVWLWFGTVRILPEEWRVHLHSRLPVPVWHKVWQLWGLYLRGGGLCPGPHISSKVFRVQRLQVSPLYRLLKCIYGNRPLRQIKHEGVLVGCW